MPSFGARSLERLETCDPRIRAVMLDVVQAWDCTILEGQRTPERQAELVRQGLSQTLRSKHLVRPLSLAVDVAPWFSDPPHVRWDDLRAFYAFGGFVLGRAAAVGVRLRWGADWDSDRRFDDHTLVDCPHFEILTQ